MKEKTQIQCAGEHVVGALICYCVLPMGHKGEHVDYRGRRFTPLFSWLRGARTHRKKMKMAA